jgi:hypothetical protein
VNPEEVEVWKEGNYSSISNVSIHIGTSSVLMSVACSITCSLIESALLRMEEVVKE